jgi:hypothetical protein
MTEQKIEKATFDDVRRYLSSAVESKYEKDEHGCYCYAWVTDFDEEYAYFYLSGSLYREGYVRDGVNVTLSDDKTQVERETTYTVVTETNLEKEQGMVERIVKAVASHFGGSDKEVSSDEEGAMLLKQFAEEEMIEVAPLYISYGEMDAHEDAYAAEGEVYKMVDNFNEALADGFVQANYFHEEMTEDFNILKAWVTECDCVIGEEFVPEGSPLVKVQYVSKDAWEDRKSGKLGGYSIGAKATVIEVEDEYTKTSIKRHPF